MLLSEPRVNLLEKINAFGNFSGDCLVIGRILVLDLGPASERQMIKIQKVIGYPHLPVRGTCLILEAIIY